MSKATKNNVDPGEVPQSTKAEQALQFSKFRINRKITRKLTTWQKKLAGLFPAALDRPHIAFHRRGELP